VFFLVTFAGFWLGRAHAFRLAWLLFASVAFYWFWNPWFLLLIAGSTSVDYLVARRLPSVALPPARRLLLATSVGGHPAIPTAFKYSPLWPVLPLGISFYPFEAISYVVDVYRGTLEPVANPLHYALYILFFPHLIAGPIVRGHELLPQLRRNTREDWAR